VQAGAPFGMDVSVEGAQDTVDASFTLTLGSNPNGATLGGNLTATVVNGIATFKGLTINLAKPYKGAVEVIVEAGLVGADGAATRSAYSLIAT